MPGKHGLRPKIDDIREIMLEILAYLGKPMPKSKIVMGKVESYLKQIELILEEEEEEIPWRI